MKWFLTRIEKEITDAEEVLHLRNENPIFFLRKQNENETDGVLEEPRLLQPV